MPWTGWMQSNDHAAALKGGPAPRDALAEGPTWLVTFATYRRRPVFDNLDLLQVCAEGLRETVARNGYRVYALAVMPDHVHLVIGAGRTGHSASKVLNNLKGVASRRLFQAAPDLKQDLRSAHLWTDEYQAKALPELGAVGAACRYVAANPGKLGLPDQRYSWAQSPGPPFRAAARSRRTL